MLVKYGIPANICELSGFRYTLSLSLHQYIFPVSTFLEESLSPSAVKPFIPTGFLISVFPLFSAHIYIGKLDSPNDTMFDSAILVKSGTPLYFSIASIETLQL